MNPNNNNDPLDLDLPKFDIEFEDDGFVEEDTYIDLPNEPNYGDAPLSLEGEELEHHLRLIEKVKAQGANTSQKSTKTTEFKFPGEDDPDHAAMQRD